MPRRKSVTQSIDIGETHRAKFTPRGRGERRFVTKMNIATEIEPPSSEPSVVAGGLNVERVIDVPSGIDVTPDEEVVASSKTTDAPPEVDVAPPDTRVTPINADATSSKVEAMPVDKSSDIGAPSRGLRRKPRVDQRRRRHSVAAVAVMDPSRRESATEEDVAVESDADESGGSCRGNIKRGEESSARESISASTNGRSTTERTRAIEEARTGESVSERTKSEDSSGAEDEKATLDRAILGAWKARATDGSVAESRSGTAAKKKKVKSLLRSSLERKVETVERMLEDRVERILEENVEKHPWLQPIESWIADRKPQRDAEPAYDFKFTAATRENEEPKIEIKVTTDDRGAETREPKNERRVIEHLRKLRNRAGSPRRNRFEPTAQPRKQEDASSRYGEESANAPPIDPGVLEMKEVKRYDLLDKLKDNVKEKMEDIHRYFQKTNRLADVNRRLKSQIWSSVVTIVLVEAKNLLPMDIDGLSDPYVKFRLGTEKYKSKVVNKTLNPVWLEQFDLHLYEDPYLGQELEVTVWDRDKSHQDDLMGKTVIDLATLERETTHRLWRELEDGSGSIFLLLTISGTTASETISDLSAHEENPLERTQLIQRYAVVNTLQRIRDVGHLTVKVYRAQGLAAADLGGKSDPFCVLELVNSRLQTQTEYKTLAPNWQKIFTFNVKDINSVLEVTVYDEDRDHKVEFLGKVAIPLLKIRNGEKRWYALKDKKLRGRAKGNCPQILLEMTVIWNIFRACVRTLNPKEKKYMEPEMKFKRQVFLRNVLRLKAIIVIFIDIGKYVQSCWEWENKIRSVVALIIFVLGCYYFEPYMIPGLALMILLKYYLVRHSVYLSEGLKLKLPSARHYGSLQELIDLCRYAYFDETVSDLSGERSGFNHWICGQVAAMTGAPLIYATSQFQDYGAEIGSDDCPPTPGDDDDDEDDKDKEEKKSLKERLQAIQEVTQIVQNSIGYLASLCERVKNLFNFTVPYLSYLAILLTILGAIVLYFIPVRYLILAWGVNKFFRKIFRPHSVPNNELLDLISRVPDDEELLNYRELKPVPTADCEKGGGSPGTSATRREQRKKHKAA